MMIILGVICVIVLIVIIGKKPLVCLLCASLNKYINNRIHNTLCCSAFPQCTSAPKKSRSYPSLIQASLLQKKKNQTTLLIDDTINHRLINLLYVCIIPPKPFQAQWLLPFIPFHTSTASGSLPIFVLLACGPVFFLGAIGYSNPAVGEPDNPHPPPHPRPSVTMQR